jgi:hypothetical protein
MAACLARQDRIRTYPRSSLASNKQMGRIMQAQPAAVWSTRLMVFDTDNLSISHNVVMSQGRYALSTVAKKIDFLYSIIGPDIHKNAIYINNPDIPETLTEICLHQGIAANILFNNSEKSQRESPSSYKARIERYNYSKPFATNEAFRMPF